MALVPLVVVLGGSEAALRTLDYPKKDPGREFTHKEVYWKQDPNQHLEPVSHKETGGTFRVSTDANGLRVPLHAEQKPAGTFRVMTLGCSTTFGWGVDDDASYPARLEALLRERGHDTIEVINGGQPGHSSFQGLWLWDSVLEKYAPDLVIFGYIVQDARKVAYSDSSQAVLQRNSEFLKAHVLYQLKTYLFLKDLIQRQRVESKDQAENAQVPRVSPDEYVENIRAFKDRASRVGATLMLFGYPLERAGYTEYYRSILKSASKDSRLGEPPLYDPQPEIERLTSQRTLYFPQDRGHANAEGNDVIARGMADFLESHALLPSRSATGR